MSSIYDQLAMMLTADKHTIKCSTGLERETAKFKATQVPDRYDFVAMCDAVDRLMALGFTDMRYRPDIGNATPIVFRYVDMWVRLSTRIGVDDKKIGVYFWGCEGVDDKLVAYFVYKNDRLIEQKIAIAEWLLH